jgi:hypothetical protein
LEPAKIKPETVIFFAGAVFMGGLVEIICACSCINNTVLKRQA